MQKWIFYLTILTLCVQAAQAQSTMSLPESDSLVETFYDNGKLRHHVEFSKGKRILTRYYSNKGLLLELDSLVGDLKHRELYHSNGELKEKGAFKGEKKFGEWKAYYDNGQLRYIDHLNEAGETEGEYIGYYPNGELREKYTRIGGRFTGEMISYYENGQLERHFFFSDILAAMNDSIVRTNVEYYENGQLQTTVKVQYGRWIDTMYAYHEGGEPLLKMYYNPQGNADGICIRYFANGHIEDSVRFVNGSKEGTFVRYFENGQLAARGTCLSNDTVGLCETWYANGQLASSEFFREGKPDGEWREYYEDGTLKSQKMYRDYLKEGEWKEYFENGQLQSFRIYVNDKVEGLVITHYSNGNVRYQGVAEHDHFVGTFTTYYESGALNSELIYSNEGSYSIKEYYEHGVPMRKGQFKNHQHTGTWYYYAEDGRLREKKKFR